MNPRTLGDVFQETQKLETEIKQLWLELAKDLESRIPAGLKKFAEHVGWVSGKKADFTLPNFLEKLAKTDAFMGVVVRSLELKEYGFEGFDDLEEKMKALYVAWSQSCRVEVYEGELPQAIHIRFYPNGIEKKPA